MNELHPNSFYNPKHLPRRIAAAAAAANSSMLLFSSDQHQLHQDAESAAVQAFANTDLTIDITVKNNFIANLTYLIDRVKLVVDITLAHEECSMSAVVVCFLRYQGHCLPPASMRLPSWLFASSCRVLFRRRRRDARQP
ncbi:hypothetical protein Cni_G26346 [Canna indica]|uniref:Uncharacterized protein n=1 Tax=Canna indica TaxID=4628 RepID=A0AAQ3KYU4_9LILI|nr:hypothetical protein Cni_G26346 [Canna indica]